MTQSDLTKENLLEILGGVADPEFQRSLSEMRMLKDAELRVDGSVHVRVELPTPAYPDRDRIGNAIRDALKTNVPEVDAVDVDYTWNVRGKNSGGSIGLTVKNIVAVGSGKGGVGKSTVAAGLAFGLQSLGASVGLMDADVYGPSLPLLMGVNRRPETEGQRILPLERYGLKLMSMGFFVNENSPVIWRGPMVHGLIKQFLTDVEWGELDYLVIDLPPGTGDAALTLTQLAPLSGAVIVTTANDLSLVDARKGLLMFEKVKVPVLGIVENMSYFVPPDLPDRKYHIFGEGGGIRIAEELAVDFLGEVPIDPRVVEGGDKGQPIVLSTPESPVATAFTQLAGTVARKLSVRAIKSPALADSNISWVT